MSRTVLIAALLAAAGIAAPAAHAAEAAPAAKPYTTAETAIGDLLDDPAAKAILVKYVPGLATSGQIDMARGLTLKALQGYAGDMLTDETLGKIDYDLAKLPPKH
jgi:para-nitrobenzyl esterase